MLEDGEISESSTESGHSIDLPSSTTHPKYAASRPSSNRPLTSRPSFSQPLSSRSSLQEAEKSFLEMYSTNADPDSTTMNGFKSSAKKMNGHSGTVWQRQIIQEKKGCPNHEDSRSNKKAVVDSRLLTYPTEQEYPKQIHLEPQFHSKQQIHLMQQIHPIQQTYSKQPSHLKPQVHPKQQSHPKSKQVQQVKKAVFINHRRLEKRELGLLEKSPPKPAEFKLQDEQVTAYAEAIAGSLKENRKDVIQKVVDACGIQKTSELCTEAQLIHSTIGMLTIDGTPRSLGGCFFQLVKLKGGLSESQKRAIFYEPTGQLSLRKKQARNAKKKMKKQKKTQQLLVDIFNKMNLDINVSIK